MAFGKEAKRQWGRGLESGTRGKSLKAAEIREVKGGALKRCRGSSTQSFKVMPRFLSAPSHSQETKEEEKDILRGKSPSFGQKKESRQKKTSLFGEERVVTGIWSRVHDARLDTK